VQESVHLTAEVLAILPEAQRQTLEMFFFQGLTLKEIAGRSHETFSNVRHHYYRGLERLREYLEEDGQEDKRRSVRALGQAKRAET
jgi:DNA-directed RNA polymerase specialized sigma24 family protein